MTSLMELFAAIGHGRRAHPRKDGSPLGYSEVSGATTSYFDPTGHRLGRSTLEGPVIVLRDASNRIVGRYQT